MTTVSIVELGTDHVETTITNTESYINDRIRDFLSNNKNEKKIIGLDLQFSMHEYFQKYYEKNSEVAIMQLYDGTKCLIIELRYLNSLPKSVFNFLQLPDFTFVGIGIKESQIMLWREYGARIKNAVDLRQLAAEVTGKPHLGFCGVDVLALKVLSLKLDKSTDVVFEDWMYHPHRNGKVSRFVVANVYAYYKIANKLLSD